MTLVVGEDRTLKEAQAGDPAAFDALVSPLLDPAYRLAMVLLRDHAEAEDRHRCPGALLRALER